MYRTRKTLRAHEARHLKAHSVRKARRARKMREHVRQAGHKGT